MPVDADTATIEKPKTAVKLESVEVEKTRRRLEKSQINSKKKRSSVNATEDVADKSIKPEYSVLEKPLDLSIPYKAPENTGLKIKQNTHGQRPESNIFASDTLKESQPLQLNGNLLMSPEPEAGKQKSVDGAGIVINIKP